jgi:sugar phosphate isomerase/epimerase
MLSITSDFRTSYGNPEADLRAIAEAGFTHVHWCHQWNTDFLYSAGEIRQIACWLKTFGLRVLDLHGSDGQEKAWTSPVAYQRRAGVELVKNRLAMAARLGADAVIMHVPRWTSEMDADGRARWEAVLRSLDAVLPLAERLGLRIAVENMAHDDFAGLRRLFTAYPPALLGLCYDAGHGNIGGAGLDHLETVKDRLMCVHLHDNDGAGDLHLPPRLGTVDWPRLMEILAGSSYRKCLSFECTMGAYGSDDISTFLRYTYDQGAALTAMMAAGRCAEEESV